MTGREAAGALRFARATSADAAEVLRVLDHAAAWLAASGVRQWPARFDAEWISPAIARGETWLVHSGGRVAGTVTLDWADPLWSDCPGEAGYVHRMAVERWAAGTGRAILAWAAGQARARGAGALRLDCVAANRRLRSYYERAGFQHRGDVEVGGAPGQRAGGGTRTLVSRYELPTGQRGTAIVDSMRL